MNGYKMFVHVNHHPRTDPLEKNKQLDNCCGNHEIFFTGGL